MIAIIKLLKDRIKIASNAILIACVALLFPACILLHKQNKTLSERVEIAQNNIEAYQDIANESWQASNVLKLDISKLSEQKDSLLLELDKVRKDNKIKANNVTTAATQTQTIDVNTSKEVQVDLIEVLKDTVYTDSLFYNDLTKIYYSIGKDSVNIALSLKNTQYLYVYKQKQYKNKKNFIKRLLTLDWKKVYVYKYNITNTNPLINTEDVRVIETTSK